MEMDGTDLDWQNIVFDRVSSRVCLGLPVPLIFPKLNFLLAERSSEIPIAIFWAREEMWVGLLLSVHLLGPCYLYRSLLAPLICRRIPALSCDIERLNLKFVSLSLNASWYPSKLFPKTLPSLRRLRHAVFASRLIDLLAEEVLRPGFAYSAKEIN